MNQKRDLSFTALWMIYLFVLIGAVYVARYVYINFFQ
jgi:hypothetical protein